MAQIISSLAAGLFLALAAIQLSQPMALLALAICCMFAWVSHDPNMPLAIRSAAQWLGISLGLAITLYLFVNL